MATTGVGAFFLSRDGRTVYYAVGGGSAGVAAAAVDAAARRQPTRQSGLYSVGIDGRDRRRIAAGTFAGMQPTADRRAIYFRGAVRAAGGDDAPPQGAVAARAEVGFPIERLTHRRRRAQVRRADGGARGAAPRPLAAGAGEQVNFAFNVRVDRRDEWKQMLDESYRVMKYRYYDREDARQGLGGDLRALLDRCSSTPARTKTSTTSPTR